MDEATTDKEHSSASDSKPSEKKAQGWIRLHLDEKVKSSSVDEPLGEKIPSSDRRIQEENKETKENKERENAVQ